MAAVRLIAPLDDAVNDAELIERMADGDRDALGTLFDRHHRALYGFLARASDAEEPEIEDLVQTAFLEAFRAAARFRGTSSPRTWLFAIGGNIAKMHRRATRRRTRAIQRLAAQPERTATALDARVADQRALAQVEVALAALPHRLRVAYVMCVIEGIATDDAARALGIARGSIWRRVHLARQQLRAAVESEAKS